TADRNRSHWSTSKTPSYTKSVSWQHHPILLTGIVCTVVLNEIDAQCHLSEKLKYAIRDGLKRQQELDKWKRENMTPFMYVLNTPPVI
ncbi:hypothetical protein OIM68_20480, partial [Escherichia coli]|nr:hypothetical protein [Escherichia coli]MCV8343022.1 hypothetical protein [Escherichia coli]